jgi:hypothetical protein
MTLAAAERQLGRTDRYVRRGRLRIGPGAPRHRLAFAVEEALRLCALPGENEGRLYYFRRLFIVGLPENGDRRTWLDAFQHGLTELARGAVHGADPVAESANAVFFRNETEACEALLARVARRQVPDTWFWSAVSGVASEASPPQHVIGVIEKLLRGPAAWAAVAAAVHAAIDLHDPLALLGQMSEARAGEWLSMIGDGAVPRIVAPVRFAPPMRAAIARAVAAFGPEDPRVLWLASLAVVQSRPSDLGHGVVVSRARESLRAIDPGSSSQRRRPDPAGGRPAEPTHAGTIDRGETAKAEQRPGRPVQDDARSARASDGIADSTAVNSPDATSSGPPDSEPGLRPDRCFGAATAGAGLYFLLNALRYLKTPDDRFGPWFLAHLLRRMAHHAGIAPDDPILLWTRVTLDRDDPEEIDERLLRVWAVKIRRWCWRNGRIAAREVICRPGRVTLTATDLDVSLALDAVDIRIRRIGLDLDPGWVPWFGRVVRFHYLPAGELHA